MISNIPAFAVHQDYQARHSDMLASARRGKDAEVVLRASWQPYPGPQEEFFNEPKSIIYYGGRRDRRLNAEQYGKWLTSDWLTVDKQPKNRQP
jgi:hypothetical protein